MENQLVTMSLQHYTDIIMRLATAEQKLEQYDQKYYTLYAEASKLRDDNKKIMACFDIVEGKTET